MSKERYFTLCEHKSNQSHSFPNNQNANFIRATGNSRNYIKVVNMNMDAIGNNVARLMTENNMDINEFAERMNVPVKTANRWINSSREPKAYAVYRMSKIFNVTMETIVEGIEDG